MGQEEVVDFETRRALARARLDAIDPAFTASGAAADPQRRDWFEAVYDLAQGDAAAVPWARSAVFPLLAQWLARRGPLNGLRAVDVGCGLGDNAEALAAAGATVTAFDLVERATDWARRRFPDSAVTYCAADLFALPATWRGTFDLVHECYTLQALPDTLLPGAARALAALAAPRGALLVISRAREAGALDGPPWPLTRVQIEGLAVDGLRLETLEDIAADGDLVRHWRALFRRNA
jgi:2-polyprenyl-3-methyl-5-hydroxy-6-metoxy-1,4-benzoquinol methylase